MVTINTTLKVPTHVQSLYKREEKVAHITVLLNTG